MEKQKKNELSTANWIVKSNTLNEIRNSRMTVSQMRLFSVYLSKINPKDINSREVTFKLDEYIKIMDFKQANITRLRETAKDLLRIIITIEERQKDDEKLRPFCSFQLFKCFKLYRNNDDEWVVNINCHDDVLPLMFELKKYYFKYKLWNALQLSSTNQQRMYEILKQYEYVGAREISVKDLREFLGIEPEEYPRWDNFRQRVLDSAQEALANYTDIKFTWEIIGKRGKGGKINTLKFNIEKNDNYMRQLSFDEFLTDQKETEIEDELQEFKQVNDPFTKDLLFLSEACNDEFGLEEMQILYNLLVKIIHFLPNEQYYLNMYDYLKGKYDELNWRATKTDVKNRFAYLKKIIES
jgi:plasmid replication initiation protein